MPALARRYVTVVTAVGLVVTFVAVVDVCRAPAHSASLWILAAFAVVGEMVVPIRGRFPANARSSHSRRRVFALLPLGQVELAILAQVIGSAAGDLARSKPWWKTLFNLAQYSISVAAAGAVLGVVGQYRPDSPNAFAPTALLLMFLSGVTLYLVNNALIAIAIATSQGISLRVLLRNDVLFQAAVMFVLLSQAPLLVLAIDRAMGLVPLFLPAVAVAYRNSRVSVQRDHEALHDALTDLPNRTSFHREVRRLVEREVDQPVAVMLIELDDFREVNETLGHSIGDGLLIELGARLQSTLSDVGFVARLGGDEFVLAAPLRDGGVREVADRVDEIVAAPFELDGVAFRLRASIGAAVCPDHGRDPEVLLQRAEVAMYVAKEKGSRFQVYSPTIDRHDPRRLALIGELHDAIGSGQLVVHYQPVASLRRARSQPRKRSCVGSTRSTASSCPTSSSRSPRRQATSTSSPSTWHGRRSRNARGGANPATTSAWRSMSRRECSRPPFHNSSSSSFFSRVFPPDPSASRSPSREP